MKSEVWTTQDPTGLAADVNPYRFVGNQPTNATDPTGLFEIQLGDFFYYAKQNVAAAGGRLRDVGRGMADLGLDVANLGVQVGAEALRGAGALGPYTSYTFEPRSAMFQRVYAAGDARAEQYARTGSWPTGAADPVLNESHDLGSEVATALPRLGLKVAEDAWAFATGETNDGEALSGDAVDVGLTWLLLRSTPGGRAGAAGGAGAEAVESELVAALARRGGVGQQAVREVVEETQAVAESELAGSVDGARFLESLAPNSSAANAQRFQEQLILENEVGPYGNLADELPRGKQAHHLNQDAAFRDVIPSDQGEAIGLRGNAFTQRGTPHFEAHGNLEPFWNQFRRGGARFGQRPTNAEYGQALEESMRAAGFSEEAAAAIGQRARANRQAFGLNETDLVPRIPGRINQAR